MVQNGCDVKILETQPPKHEIYQFEMPTYVLSFSPEGLQLYYYVKGADEKQIDIHADEHLKQALKDYHHFSDVNSVTSVLIESAIRKFNQHKFGTIATDTTLYAKNSDAIAMQLHTEDGGKRKTMRTTERATPSGVPLVETNVHTEEIEKKAISITDRLETTLAYGDTQQVSKIALTNREVHADKDIDVSGVKKTGQVFATNDAKGLCKNNFPFWRPDEVKIGKIFLRKNAYIEQLCAHFFRKKIFPILTSSGRQKGKLFLRKP